MGNEESSGGISRREFIGKMAVGASALAFGTTLASPRAYGANERIRVGLVGLGDRMGALASECQKLSRQMNHEIVAVCDIWRQRREAWAAKVKDWTGQDPVQCRTLAEICDRKDVDALIIATADFQHATHMAYAVRAGKDVYVEKPFGCDFRQIKDGLKAVKETGRIVQMGTQRRGNGLYEGARRFIQQGHLGRITFVEIYEPLFQQRWRIPGAETSIREEDTDWKEFQSYTYNRRLPFNPRHYREFRLFWPYSSGIFCQWMSHQIDVVNWVLGETPRYAVALGGIYVWRDGRTNPDTVQCLLEYPSGVLCTYHMRLGNGANGRGITIYGTNGTMDLEAGVAYGDGGGGEVCPVETPAGAVPTFRVDQTKLLKAKKDGGVKWESPPSVDYMAHFFECVRTRQRSRGDVDAGYAHAVATILANQSLRNGCRMEYDAQKMEMRRADVG